MKKLIILTLIFIAFFRTALPVGAAGKQDYKITKITLLEGWNLFSFPFDPAEKVIFASDVLTSMNLQGGVVMTIAKWEKGHWLEYVKRGNGEIYGKDFIVEPGRSYFVRSGNSFKFQAAGYLSQLTKFTLEPGYNFVSFPALTPAIGSGEFLGRISGSKDIGTLEISRFFSGLFETNSRQDNQNFGRGFPVDRLHGYVIKLDKPLNFSL